MVERSTESLLRSVMSEVHVPSPAETAARFALMKQILSDVNSLQQSMRRVVGHHRWEEMDMEFRDLIGEIDGQLDDIEDFYERQREEVLSRMVRRCSETLEKVGLRPKPGEPIGVRTPGTRYSTSR